MAAAQMRPGWWLAAMLTVLASVAAAARVSQSLAAEAADAGAITDLVIRLEGAAFRDQRDRRPAGNADVFINVANVAGRWEEETPACAPEFNKNWHKGTISEVRDAGDRLTMTVQIGFMGDYHARGGSGRYVVNLIRKPDALSGTYEGTFRGVAVSGRASALVPRRLDSMLPAKPGEHPRLIFRRDDVPAIRRRAATPPGRALIQRVRQILGERTENASMAPYAPGHALLYVITGETREAQLALNLVRHSLENDTPSLNYAHNCWPLLNIAATYDMCYDAWDAESRIAVGNELRRRSRDLLTFYDSHGYRRDIAWWFVTVTRSTAGVCALAVLGDPAHSPDAEMPVLKTTAQPQGFEPGRGVPVVPFQDNRSPDAWLFAGPFPLPRPPSFSTCPPDVDYLASIGGRERAAPSAGTQVVWDQISRTFQKLPSGFLTLDSYGRLRIEAWEAAGHTPLSVWYFYTVIHNDKPRYVMPSFHFRNCAVWVAGQRIRERQPFVLGAGYIPVMVQTAHGKTSNWETEYFVVNFETITEGTARGYMDWLQEERRQGILVTDPPLRWQYRGARTGLDALLNDGRALLRDDVPTQHAAGGLAGGLLPFLLAARNTLAVDLRLPGDELLRALWTAGAGQSAVEAKGILEQLRQDRSVMARALFLCPPQDLRRAKRDLDSVFGLAGEGTCAIVHPLDAVFIMAHYPFEE